MKTLFRHFILGLLTVAWASVACAQTSFPFQRTFRTDQSGEDNVFKQTSDRGYIIASRLVGQNSIYLVKTDSLGNKQWSKQIDSSSASDILQTKDGGYLIAGAGLIQLDASGNAVKKSFIGIWLISIKENSSRDGYLMVGTTGSDNLLMEIDLSLNLRWSTTWKNNELPGDDRCVPTHFMQASDSSIYVCSRMSYKLPRTYLSKLTNKGKIVWMKYVASASYGSKELPIGLKETYDKKLIYGHLAEKAVYFELFDTSGTLLSSKGYTLKYYFYSNCPWQLANPTIDNSIIFGYSYPNESPLNSIVMAKLDSSGNIIQTKTVGAKKSSINDFIFNDRMESVILGYTQGLSFEKSDIYLLKSDSNQSLGCYGDTLIGHIEPNKDKATPMIVNFTVNSVPPTTSKACSSKPIFDLSYNACECIPPFADFTTYSNTVSMHLYNTSKRGTEFLWNFGNGLTDTVVNPKLPYTKDGTYTVCLKVSNACGTDSVCKKINFVIPNAIKEINPTIPFHIYPNPFKEQTTLAFETEQKNTTIKLVDVLGKEIREFHFSGTRFTVNKEDIQPGIYFVQIIDQEKRTGVKRIIIQ